MPTFGDPWVPPKYDGGESIRAARLVSSVALRRRHKAAMSLVGKVHPADLLAAVVWPNDPELGAEPVADARDSHTAAAKTSGND
jgi:hypothetical protein